VKNPINVKFVKRIFQTSLIIKITNEYIQVKSLLDVLLKVVKNNLQNILLCISTRQFITKLNVIYAVNSVEIPKFLIDTR